ncbi:MAG: TIGR01777 family protein, partial [Chitinophagia bacterium]|nr:TIGR01777 family protein [Chitinophagia bacterium]
GAKIGVTGGTGLIGSYVIKELLARGYEVVVFTRSQTAVSTQPGIEYAYWNAHKQECETEALAGLQGMIHLAGAGIADKKWTADRKWAITNSRIAGTKFIIRQLKDHAPECTAFVGASATGYYATALPGSAPLTESAPPGTDFLANTCKLWEQASEEATGFLRRTILRVGIVLGKRKGYLHEMLTPLQWGIIPIIGNGTPMVSWISATDVARLFVYALENNALAGIYNAVAPKPVSQADLLTAIAGHVCGAKLRIKAPEIMLKLALGEMSTELLKSTHVSAAKVLISGFAFQHKEVGDALNHELGII